MPQRILFYRSPVDQAALLLLRHIIWNELYKGCLGRAGLPHDTYRLSGTDMEINIRKDIFLRIFSVFEIYMGKFNLSAADRNVLCRSSLMSISSSMISMIRFPEARDLVSIRKIFEIIMREFRICRT